MLPIANFNPTIEELKWDAPADANAAGYVNSTAVGRSANITASNQVRLGNSTIGSIGGYAPWTDISDGRFKKNVTENVIGLDFIMKLRPVTYNLDVWQLAKMLDEDNHLDENGTMIHTAPDVKTVEARNEKGKVIYSGFVAQEVEKAAQSSRYNFSGLDAPKNAQDLYGLRYAGFVVPLVKAVQEQQLIIQEQQKKIDDLEKKFLALEKLLINK